MPSHRRCRSLLIAAALILLPASFLAQTPDQKHPKQTFWERFLGIKPDYSGGWLYVGYKNSSSDGLYFAVSKDAYHWEVINFDRPVVWQSSRDELMRDPFIQRAPDGTFRLVWTWSTEPAIIGYSTSTDLIHWSQQIPLPVAKVLPTATNVSAPTTFYNPAQKDWLLLFTAASPSESSNLLYATTTTNFKQFQPAKPFVDKQPESATTSKVTLPAGLSHGTLLHLQTSEYNLLLNYHGMDDSALDK